VTWSHHAAETDPNAWEDVQRNPWRAGRLPNRPPRTPVEEFSAVLRRFHSLVWLSGCEFPLGTPTAQETMKVFQRDRLAPALREMGFQGSGSKFRIRDSDPAGYISVNRHRYSNRLVVGFTLNLSVGWPLDTASWCRNLAAILQHDAGEQDCEWRLPAGADTGDLIEDVVASLRSYGLPAMEAALQELLTG
jgi:hypothetical protein